MNFELYKELSRLLPHLGSNPDIDYANALIVAYLTECQELRAEELTQAVKDFLETRT